VGVCMIQLVVYGYISRFATPKGPGYVSMLIEQGQGFQPMMKPPEEANMVVVPSEDANVVVMPPEEANVVVMPPPLPHAPAIVIANP